MNNKSGPTVDDLEVERHSDLKNNWWMPNGSVPCLHIMNDLRIPYITEGIKSTRKIIKNEALLPLANIKILDVGCGGGLVSEPLAKLGAIVTGIDPSAGLIDLAKEHSINLGPNKPTYYCTTLEEHAPNHQNYYDAVVASEVISHLVNKELFFKLCVETLKPGGKIFITAPNRTWLSYFLGIYLTEYILKVVAKGLHDYEKFISPEDVTRILQKNNCRVDNTRGLIYYPFLHKWQWVFFKSIWYALEATKLE
ncbi:unnamed protein product [Colias eurytheme]|nr:unnamed protein product [Colias eurytheme]